MIGVTFFGLFFTPVFYSVIRRLTRHTAATTESGEAVPARYRPDATRKVARRARSDEITGVGCGLISPRTRRSGA
jgi:hypothetical protein